MTEGQRPIPEADQIVLALEEMIGPRLSQPIHADESDIARARSVLTLECVGGPTMPTMAEREERFQAVRGLLRNLAPRFRDLPRSELVHLTHPRGEPRGDVRYAREGKRLAVGARALFQLHSAEPDPDVEINEIQSAANSVWGKPKSPGSRWFERFRMDFVCGKLADWIIEYERNYREANLPPAPESDAESAAATTSPRAASLSEDAPDPLKESPPPEPTGSEVADETEDDDPGDESPADLDDERLAVLASPFEPSHRLRIGRLAGGAFVVALVTGALVAALVLAVGGSESSGNAAGEIRRVLNVRAPEDLAVAGGFAWLVNANDETAIRVSEATGKQETIFVDQPPFVSGPLPSSHTHTGARTGGYRVAAGPNGAWIVTNGGVVLGIGTTGRQVRILNPHIRILAGEPVLYRGSLWVVGFGEYLYRLRARDGVIQREYKPLTDPFLIDNLAAGVGSIWAYNDSSGNNPKINILTPVPGRWGVKESVLPLDRPANDLAAGLGAVWTLNADETVTRYDPATGGSSRPIQVPGGAQALALGQDAVWIGTGNDTAVRIDPTTLAMVGEPIRLPGKPIAIGADENAWVATSRKLVEIES
jgi:hypothetical protein